MVGTDAYFSIEDESPQYNKIKKEIDISQSIKRIRKFVLYRFVDVSGISGSGIVAIGTEFDGKKCVLNWVDSKQHVNSLVIYDSIHDLEKIHGHDGRTAVMFAGENE